MKRSPKPKGVDIWNELAQPPYLKIHSQVPSAIAFQIEPPFFANENTVADMIKEQLREEGFIE